MRSPQYKILYMGKYKCRSISRFHPLLFLIYINNLAKVLTTNAKLFSDDTSLFSVAHDTQTPANDLNKDLEINN